MVHHAHAMMEKSATRTMTLFAIIFSALSFLDVTMKKIRFCFATDTKKLKMSVQQNAQLTLSLHLTQARPAHLLW